ncbi:MAG: DUF362 domain-containing protein, partial [bacterium]
GAALFLGGKLAPEMRGGLAMAATDEACHLAAIKGTDPAACTVAAVEQLGGMGKFVGEGARVLINVNNATKHRGSNVDPVVVLAIVKLCREAGAGDICLAKGGPDRYWEPVPESEEKTELLAGIRVSEREFEVVPIPEGVALKEAHVDKELLAADVFINVPLVKDHTGTNFTGALKNFMGVCSHDPTNRFCHMGATPEAAGFYEDLGHLAQCIADMNLVRVPDLTVMDCFEFLTTNGPFGPGDLGRGDTVLAGVDPVAIDAYSARFLGLEPGDVEMIDRGRQLGLGRTDLEKLNIVELDL